MHSTSDAELSKSCVSVHATVNREPFKHRKTPVTAVVTVTCSHHTVGHRSFTSYYGSRLYGGVVSFSLSLSLRVWLFSYDLCGSALVELFVSTLRQRFLELIRSKLEGSAAVLWGTLASGSHGLCGSCVLACSGFSETGGGTPSTIRSSQ